MFTTIIYIGNLILDWADVKETTEVKGEKRYLAMNKNMNMAILILPIGGGGHFSPLPQAPFDLVMALRIPAMLEHLV